MKRTIVPVMIALLMGACGSLEEEAPLAAPLLDDAGVGAEAAIEEPTPLDATPEPDDPLDPYRTDPTVNAH